VADNRLVGDAPAAAASHKKKSTAAAAATAAANKAAADAVAAAAADVITINIPSLPEKEITVGQVRHRLCEPLLRGKNGGDTVWEGMGRAISNATMSPAEKMAVWEGVVVVGETAYSSRLSLQFSFLTCVIDASCSILVIEFRAPFGCSALTHEITINSVSPTWPSRV
jgi:hypothetical protein